MRLLMMRGDVSPRLGALHNGRVAELGAMAEEAGVPLPSDLLGVIESGSLDSIERLLANAPAGSPAWLALDDVELLAPLDPPRGNVLAIGRNYAEHAKEGAAFRDEEIQPPTVFTKAQTAINTPYGDIHVDRALTQQVDYEAELAVVIGREGKDIPIEQALNHVFGYCALNDVSARDLQYGWGGQFFKGKSLDGFCPFGPWIVTRNEVPDPQRLQVRCRVNGETRQDANTADMIYPVARIIAELSRGMTLLPGTLIATGTPAGVGLGHKPPKFLDDGDVVEVEVEGVGMLRNRVVFMS